MIHHRKIQFEVWPFKHLITEVKTVKLRLDVGEDEKKQMRTIIIYDNISTVLLLTSVSSTFLSGLVTKRRHIANGLIFFTAALS